MGDRRLQEVGRLPLPSGSAEWHALSDPPALTFVGLAIQVCHSLLDGRLLWDRVAPGVSSQVLGASTELLVLQEQRRGPGSRFLEGVDVATGVRRWRSSASTQAMGGGVLIGEHLYASCPFEPGSLKIELATGRSEIVDARPRCAGPGGWYGVARNRLVRFDGTTTTDVGPAPKLGLMGIAGTYAVLARQYAGAEEVVVVDLTDGAQTTHPLGEPHFVVVRGERIVLTAMGRTSDGFGLDPAALARGSHTPAWTTPGVFAVAADRVGTLFLATGLGLVDADDGRVLVTDPELDRACGTETHLATWSSRGTEATLYGSVS